MQWGKQIINSAKMKKQSKIRLSLKDAARENPRVVGEALFQILNLVISIFAFSVFIAAASAVTSPTVKAQTSQGCCEKIKDKSLFCQNSLLSNCETKFSSAPTSCDSTSFCKLGCCYDSKEGTCAENTPRKVCGLSNGTWDSNGNCNIPQCQMGCCVLGDQASLTTLVRCKKLASYYGLETDYRSAVTSEASCVAIAQASDKGACIITTGVETTCKLTSRADCKGLTHNDTAFNKGFLCSAEQLGTPCTRQARTGCLDGKDEVYWFDSCGNPENIYDADKTRSWNSGKILDKDRSCNPDSANTKNPSCGNCNYYQGSMCGSVRTGVEPRPSYGNYICRDLNCYDTYNEKDYKHGESWCVYDGPVGQGNDLVGSRHWRHLCVMGEEKVEPCDDYRQSICVEDKVEVGNSTSGGGSSQFNEAVCKPNRWRECIDYNNKANPEKSCGQNKDCYMTSVWGGKKLCLPAVPSGFNLNLETGQGVAESICSSASQKCTVIYVKELLKGWVCKQNCECEKPQWVTEMNKWCTSLGDCGGKYNIADKYTTDGYSITGTENTPAKEKGMGAALPTAGIGAAMFFASGGKALMSVFGGTAASAAPALGGSAGGQSLLGFAKVGEFAMSNQVAGPLIYAAAAAVASLIINKLYGLKGSAANMVTMAGVASSAGAGFVMSSVYTSAATVASASTSASVAVGTTLAFEGGTFIIGQTGTTVASIVTSAAQTGAYSASQLSSLASTALTHAGATSTAASTMAPAMANAALAQGATTSTVAAAGNAAAGSAAASNVPILGWFQTAFGAWGVFWFAVVVMVIIALVMKLMKIGEKKEKIIAFTCSPWQPPIGGADCEKCNGDPMKPCSDYRCKSLGAACSLLNPDTDNQTCVHLDQYDTNAPTIKPWQQVLTYGHSYNSIQPCPPGPGCWKITRQGAADGCIKAFTPLQFGITTNEPAQCRVETNHTSKFDDMQYWFGGMSLYLYNSSMQMSLPGPEHINAQAPELKNDGKYTLYIRCRDGNGNWNLGEMAVSFCVEPGPDTTPPVIMRTGIINGAPVAAGTTSTQLDVFLNEPSECKWSKTDQEYANMNNTFTCSSNIEQMEGDLTYKCSTTLTKIQDRVANTFYFRCKDQPWLTTNESDRNVNKESYVFKLEGTIPLNITTVGPNGTVKGGAEPIQVTLIANTANGYNNGDATCYYSTQDYDNMIEFFTTGTNHHEQNLDLWAGDYKFYILCRDLAGNIDKNSTSFKVELDKTAPLIVRAYQDGGMLKIITEEESDCRYGIKDCNYDFLSGTEMPFTNSTEHTAEWRTDITYYIKCMDQYGNMPVTSQCQMQVNAYDVPSGP